MTYITRYELVMHNTSNLTVCIKSTTGKWFEHCSRVCVAAYTMPGSIVGIEQGTIQGDTGNATA
jgi:hypothetical protein